MNTLEAAWFEELRDASGNVTEIRPVSRRNYSIEQKDEFAADCGPAAQKYITMAGW
jgi:hypothetical protein